MVHNYTLFSLTVQSFDGLAWLDRTQPMQQSIDKVGGQGPKVPPGKEDFQGMKTLPCQAVHRRVQKLATPSWLCALLGGTQKGRKADCLAGRHRPRVLQERTHLDKHHHV